MAGFVKAAFRRAQRKRYPPDWPQISLRLRRRGRCDWCSARGGHPHPDTGKPVRLTAAHVNSTPEDCRPANLRCLCKSCHIALDRAHIRRVVAMLLRAEMNTPDLFQDYLVAEGRLAVARTEGFD